MEQLNEFLVKNNTAPKLSDEKVFNEILADWHKEEDGIHKLKGQTVITKSGIAMNWYKIWKYVYSNPNATAAEIREEVDAHPLLQILNYLTEKHVLKLDGRTYIANMPNSWNF